MIKHATPDSYFSKSNINRFLHALDQYKIWRRSWEEILANISYDVSNDWTCWIWTRELNKKGRATLQIRVDVLDPTTGKTTRKEATVNARKYAYELVIGKPLDDSDWIANHRCHNKQCVNPLHGHLTTKENWFADRERMLHHEMQQRAKQQMGTQPTPLRIGKPQTDEEFQAQFDAAFKKNDR